MKLRSFQMRFMLWTWAVLLVALSIVFYSSTTLVRQDLVSQTERRAWEELEAIGWLIEEHVDFESEKDFAQWIDALGAKLGTRITFICNGRVIADSAVTFPDLPTMDDHSDRPEVVAALGGEGGSSIRFSDTLQLEMLYVASVMKGTSGLPGGVLRVAQPVSKIGERIVLLERNFILTFLVTLVLAWAVSGLVTRNMSRQITTFSEVARSIGEGDYSTRLRAVPGGEFKPLTQAVNGMALSIENNVRIIRDQKNQLQAIFEGLQEGVMALDSDGRIESYNGALDEMFNLAATTKGRTPIEVTRRFEVQNLVDEVTAHPEAGPRVAQIDLMDARTVEVSVVPYTDQQGNGKTILVFYDITEMKRTERGLKDFVANASHQLRTPLTSIKGYTETLVHTPPAKVEDAKFFLETVIKNADHMDKVISSMLALAKSEQVGKALALAPLSGREFALRTVADVQPWADETKIALKTDLPEGDLTVMGEPDGLLHVFHNLLNNAVKYSPEGGVITVSAVDEPDSVTFSVEDQGPGISMEHSIKVFERFYRVDENTIDDSGSAGLGLAICRRIVTNFGGEIWHDGYGEDVRGARFCFRLNKPGTDDAA